MQRGLLHAVAMEGSLHAASLDTHSSCSSTCNHDSILSPHPSSQCIPAIHSFTSPAPLQPPLSPDSLPTGDSRSMSHAPTHRHTSSPSASPLHASSAAWSGPAASPLITSRHQSILPSCSPTAPASLAGRPPARHFHAWYYVSRNQVGSTRVYKGGLRPEATLAGGLVGGAPMRGVL